jgi:hypothetical protein
MKTIFTFLAENKKDITIICLVVAAILLAMGINGADFR